ncbi:MAG TPA: pentapeptide repeat-containing protein [Actinophytocola sp.]|nr:pentapeptide repeat-containing protein [Actinophytocola sp.]
MTNKPLTIRAIVLGGVGLVVVMAASVVVLLALLGSGSPRDQARLDAVRTAGAIVVGLGGAVALLLTARRQRSTELTLRHQQEVAERAEHDAHERRITELYTRAADQLGNDRAPVRLAGLYALERLGVATESQRQAVANVLCAYLRMPYTSSEDIENREEGQVRLAAQRILWEHRLDTSRTFWEVGIVLDDADLAGAHFHSARLEGVTFRRAVLDGADLRLARLYAADLREVSLVGTAFAEADLRMARLNAAALSGARFKVARLEGASLHGASWSSDTRWPDAETARLVREASVEVEAGLFRVEVLQLPVEEKSGG